MAAGEIKTVSCLARSAAEFTSWTGDEDEDEDGVCDSSTSV